MKTSAKYFGLAGGP